MQIDSRRCMQEKEIILNFTLTHCAVQLMIKNHGRRRLLQNI